MFNLKLKLVFLFFSLVYLMGGQPVKIQAKPALKQANIVQQIPEQQTTDNCVGLDLVLLIDQSGSMSGGKDLKYPATDPGQARIAAAQFIIQFLFTNRKLLCDDTIHRIGVMGFGSKFVEQLAMTPIDFNASSSLETINTIAEGLTSQIKPLDLGSTNFKGGFEQVAQMFASLPDLNSTPRKKMVIVLTDGSPCVATAKECEDGTFDPLGYMSQTLVPYMNDTNGTFPLWNAPYNFQRGDIYVNFVAINNGDYYLKAKLDANKKTIKDYWEEITESHGGQVYSLGQDQLKIPETFLAIIGLQMGLIPIKGLEANTPANGAITKLDCNKPVYIDPYVQKVIFYIFKNGPTDIAFTFTSNGQTVKLVNGKAETGPSTMVESYSEFFAVAAQYVINRPEPGIWTLSCDEKDVITYKQQFFVGVNLQEPLKDLPLFDEPPYYEVTSPYYLVVKVTDQEGQPIKSNPDYPLEILVDVKKPDGQILLASEQLKSDEIGIYKSEKPVDQSQVGRYAMSITVNTDTFDRTKGKITLYKIGTLSYGVRKVNRFDFQIITPTSGQEFNLNGYLGSNPIPEPLTVTIQLVDAKGQPLSSNGVILKPADLAFTAYMTAPNQQVETQTLTVDVAQDSQFKGVFRKSVNALMTTEGDYTFKVELNPELINNQDYVVRKNSAEVQLKGLPVTAVDFQVTVPKTNGTLPWHESGFNVGGTVAPINLEVILTNLNGDVVDGATAVNNSASPLFTAKLTGPAGETEVISLTNKTTSEGLKFVGQTLAEAFESGDYQVEVNLIDKSLFKAGHVAVSNSKTVSFTRLDDWSTSPWTWRFVVLVIFLAILFVIFLYIWIFTGGPKGWLVMKGKTQLLPIKLNGKRVYISKIDSKDLGLSELDYGVKVKLIVQKHANWTVGNPIISVTLECKDGRGIENNLEIPINGTKGYSVKCTYTQ